MSNDATNLSQQLDAMLAVVFDVYKVPQDTCNAIKHTIFKLSGACSKEGYAMGKDQAERDFRQGVKNGLASVS